MEHQDEPVVEVSLESTHHFNGFPTTVVSMNISDTQSDEDGIESSEINLDKESTQSNVPTLLKVFQDLYDQRLNAIEKNVNLDLNEKNAEKLVVFQEYIRQLQEQNDTFVSAMIELETEAQQRVKQMEKRLKSSAKTTMEAAININECEKEMTRLVKERLYVESLYNDMQQHISSIKVENGFLRDQNFNLNHDVQALLHIINHARSTGHWEMNCVTFCEVTPEQVFGPVQSISAVYSSESPFDFHPYDSERKATFNSDISSQGATDSSTSSPCVACPARVQIRSADDDLRCFSNEMHNEVLEKNKRIAFLESQLSELRQQLIMKDAECECHLWKMEMLMQQHRNRVQNFPIELPSSDTSLSRCISLPDIGNIYHFSNATRKSRSLDTYGNLQALGNQLFPKISNNCVRTTQVDDGPDFEKCRSVHKKSEKKSCMRRGQSEPHLFMFGDSIYVYRPCEPIKKASNIALHDDYESSLPPCQSIDLKFPTDDSNTKISDWTSLEKKEAYTVPDSSFYKDDETTSSCTCSDPEIESCSKEVFEDLCDQLISTSVQTDKAVTYSIGLQAVVKRDDDSNTQCNCFDPGVEKFDKKVLAGILKEKGSILVADSQSIDQPTDINAGITQNAAVKENGSLQLDVSQMINTIQTLKEGLVKAEDKAQAKEMLISQLQGHLVSSVKEVELKDTALQNLEKKLDLSRNECSSLKQQVCDLNSEIQQILKDFDDAQMLNDNLRLKGDAKEEKIQEVLSEVKMLQEQKRALMTQLDAQGDELETTRKELQIAQHQAKSSVLQVEQQSQIIRNLQDALVQSKRAFDAAHQKLPISHSHSVSSNFLSEKSKSLSKTSVEDI